MIDWVKTSTGGLRATTALGSDLLVCQKRDEYGTPIGYSWIAKRSDGYARHGDGLWSDPEDARDDL